MATRACLLAGDLKYYIGNKEDDQSYRVLTRAEAEVALKTCDFCIADTLLLSFWQPCSPKILTWYDQCMIASTSAIW